MAAGAARALLYLARTQARNRWRSRLRRLREPRYLVGALAALLYLGWVAWGASSRADGPRPAALVVWVVPLLVASHWLGRPNPLALAFAQAEVDFLFTAPVSRRTLLHARLLGQQAAALAAILVWVLLLDPTHDPAIALPRALGVWVLVTALSLHRTGATLSRIAIPDAPKRPPIAKTLALAWLCIVGVAFVRAWNDAGRLEVFWAGPIIALADRLVALATTPELHAVLTPVRWLTAPTLATSAADALRTLPLALVVLATLHLWVVRDPRPFEEAAVDATRRVADRIAAARRGAWRPPRSRTTAARPTTRLPLPAHGPAALAFVWKTAVATARAYSLPSLLAVAALLAGGAITLPSLWPDADDGTALRSALLAACFVAAFITLPSWFRQDLRAELGHLVFIKTAPIPSRDIVAAHTGAAAAVASLGLLVLFAVPIAIVAADDPLLGGGTTLLLLLEALLVALPVLVLLHVTVHNAIALLFPGWARVGQAGVGGFQAMGQAYVTVAAILAALALLLVLPALAASACLRLLPGAAGIAVAILAASAVAIGEWWLACRWLGRQLDRIEPESLPAPR